MACGRTLPLVVPPGASTPERNRARASSAASAAAPLRDVRVDIVAEGDELLRRRAASDEARDDLRRLLERDADFPSSCASTPSGSRHRLVCRSRTRTARRAAVSAP